MHMISKRSINLCEETKKNSRGWQIERRSPCMKTKDKCQFISFAPTATYVCILHVGLKRNFAHVSFEEKKSSVFCLSFYTHEKYHSESPIGRRRLIWLFFFSLSLHFGVVLFLSGYLISICRINKIANGVIYAIHFVLHVEIKFTNINSRSRRGISSSGLLVDIYLDTLAIDKPKSLSLSPSRDMQSSMQNTTFR